MTFKTNIDNIQPEQVSCCWLHDDSDDYIISYEKIMDSWLHQLEQIQKEEAIV
ncbi:MAG: hypothetical protein ACR2IS_19615 [Nitrososphaeraceae archaeon]